MTFNQAHSVLQNSHKRNTLALAVLFAFVFATIGLDFLYTQVQNSAFYFSESFLFSTYWFLFLPLLSFQWAVSKQSCSLKSGIGIGCLIIVSHQLFYPVLVWLLSTLFYDHSFRYSQTFRYGLTTYLLPSLLVYGLSYPLAMLYKKRLAINPEPLTKEEAQLATTSFITTLWVADSNNQKTIIATQDILYFSASAPYVTIHHTSRNYLHTETLKSLATQLDGKLFIRTHKSYLVNINKVVSYRSRLNGDYDLTLADGTPLRVSRVYAAAFKASLDATHRLTP